MQESVRLPVVVVHHAAPDWCRSSVAAIQANAGTEVDVLVVDNSGELAAGEPLPGAVEVVRAPGNLGFAGGANLGVRLALERRPDAEVVFVCAHDFHPEPGALARLVATLADDPGLGVVAPEFGEPRCSVGGRWDGAHATNLAPSGHDPELVGSDWLCGTCLGVRRGCWEALGGFDDRFGSYVEDVDLCLRATDAGWGVVTDRRARGSGRGSASDDKPRLILVNGGLLAAKRHGRGAARRVAVGYLGEAARQLAAAVVRPDRRARLARARVHGASAWELLRSPRTAEFAAAGPGDLSGGRGRRSPARARG